MFWQENQMTSSPINTLLVNENVTLTELLEEDDILQECKSLNKQLVEFLVRPSTIYELIQLIVEEPPSNADLRLQYRNSAMACEIIASRVPTLSETIAGDPQILGKLYSFLDSKPPLNPLLASFFAKTMEVLLTHSTVHQNWYTYQFMCLQVIEYFTNCPNFLPKVLEHIGTSGIMNSLQYISLVPVNDMKYNILSWLDSENLIEKLIALICGMYEAKFTNTAGGDTSVLRCAIVNLDNENSSDKLQECVESKINAVSPEHPVEKNSEETEPVKSVETPVGTDFNDELKVIESSESPKVVESSDGPKVVKSIESPKVIESSEGPESVESSEAPKAVESSEDPKAVESSEGPNAVESALVTKSIEPSEKPTIEPSEEPKVAEDLLVNGPIEYKKIETVPCLVLDPQKLDERLLTSRSSNASQLICSFISKGREPNTDQSYSFINPLLAKCLSAEIIDKLLESMFSCLENNRKNAIFNGIQVLLTLLNEETGQVIQTIEKQEEIHRIAKIITPWLPQFVNILNNPPPTSSGVGKDAVGVARLTVARLLVTLVGTDSPAVAAAMVQHRVFSLLLDLFFHYQWNNFLHAHVEDIIQKALSAPDQKDLYKKHLFNDCKLIQRIHTAWEENSLPDKPRYGYMGHLIQIANHIQAALGPLPLPDDSEPIPDLDLWENLRERLNEVNQLYSTCLGGHHPVENNLLGGIQLSQQECYATEYQHHDVNFNGGDDIINDTNELGDNSEQLFSSICDNTSSSMGGNGVADHWTNANVKNITGDILSGDGTDKTTWMGNIEHSAFLDLLNNYTEYETMNEFNKWLINNDCADWMEDNGEDPVSVPIPSIADTNSSPWGDIGNLSNEQSGWADFGNLQETAGISNVPNTFTCKAFAAFDQVNVPSEATDSGEENKTVILKVELEDSNSSEEPSAVRIQQIQSETSTDTIISVAGGMPTFADIVRQQPGAQILVESEGPQTASDSIPVDKSIPTEVVTPDVDSLTRSLANVSITDKCLPSSGEEITEPSKEAVPPNTTNTVGPNPALENQR